MPTLPTRFQQPQPVAPQVDLPADFPEIPTEIKERFPDAVADWQRRLDEFWTRTNQAIQQAQQQVAGTVNSRVVFSVDQFLIYVNGQPQPMFSADQTGVRLGDVLVVNTPGRKVYIGQGNYNDDQTPFYIDTLGFFSLGDSLTWDPDTDTLTINGIINATSGTIGGFEIGTDYIRDTANTFGLASTVTGAPDWRFWAGAPFANRSTAPVRIREDGQVYFEFMLCAALNVDGSLSTISSFATLSGTKEFVNCEGINLNSMGWRANANGGVFRGIQNSPSIYKETYTGLTVYGYQVELTGALGTGTISNAYGIYIDTVNIGTANWGLYVATTARNYMAGDLTVASIGATTPGTGAFTTLGASGVFTSTSANDQPLRATGATTGGSALRITNTGGSAIFGQEDSAGGHFIVGSSAYDTSLRGETGLSFSANAGSALHFRISSSGGVNIPALAGVGTRNVVADASGNLSAP